MDDAGQRIRELKDTMGQLHFDRKTSNDIGAFQAQCRRRNLQGECAVPGVLDEFGQNMSQDDFARHIAAGRDPRQVYKQNPNQFAGFSSALGGR
jgi:hypothetical protein